MVPTLNRENCCLTVGGQEVSITPREYTLLAALEDAHGAVVRTRTLREGVFGSLWFDKSNLQVYIWRLRQKLEVDPRAPRHLLNVRGFGYRLV